MDSGLKELYKLMLKKNYEVELVRPFNGVIYIHLIDKAESYSYGKMIRQKVSTSIRPKDWLKELLDR